MIATGATGEPDLAGVRREHARDDVDHASTCRRRSGRSRAWISPRRDRERRIVEREHAGEALGERRQFESGGRCCRHRRAVSWPDRADRRIARRVGAALVASIPERRRVGAGSLFRAPDPGLFVGLDDVRRAASRTGSPGSLFTWSSASLIAGVDVVLGDEHALDQDVGRVVLLGGDEDRGNRPSRSPNIAAPAAPCSS